MGEIKLKYKVLTSFNKIGDVEQGIYKSYDQINIQPGIDKLMFKFEKNKQIVYLPTESDLNKKLRMIEPDKTITITYTKDELIGMAGTIKIFEII